MNTQTKEMILRSFETYCYRICYFFMEDEQLSVQAAREALLTLARDPSFFIDSDENREQKVKHVAIRSTLNMIRTKVR